MRLGALATIAAVLAATAAQAKPPILSGRPVAVSLQDDTDPQVSPDGRWLAFVRRDGLHRQLCVLRLDRDGAAPRPVAEHVSDSWGPAWSPSGRRLAFETTRTDALGDVAVATAPFSSARSISSNGIADTLPVWRSEDGISWVSDAPGTRMLHGRTGKLIGQDTQSGHVPWPGELHRSGALCVVATVDTNGDGVLGEGDAAAVLDWSREAGPRLLTRSHANLVGASARDAGRLIACVRGAAGLDLVESRADSGLSAEPATLLATARAALSEGRHDEARDLAYAASLAAVDDATRGDSAALWFALDLAHGRGAAMLPIVDRLFPSVEDGSLIGALRLRALAEREARAVSRGSGGPEGLGLLLARSSRAAERGATGAALAALHMTRASALARLDRMDEALASVDSAVAADPASAWEPRLERGRLYRRMRLRAESEAEFIRICEDAGSPRLAVWLAVEELTDGVRGDPGAMSGEALVALAARVGDPGSRAAIEFSAADELRREGRLDAASRVLEGTLGRGGTPAAARLDAAIALAGLRASTGRFEEALAGLEEIREEAGFDAAALGDSLRRGLAAQLEARGRDALALRDHALARAMFTRVLADYPGSVTAWRGRIEAEASLDGELEPAIRRYRDAARASEADALAWYRYGLARSYRSGDWRGAEHALERAVRLDPSVHWYHQTLGYVREQLWRTERKREDAIDAQDSYEAALALLPSDADASAVAALYQNSGNIALEIGRDDEAARLLDRRLGTGAPFDHPVGELLFHRNHGIALFRAGRPADAAKALRRALATLPAAREARPGFLVSDAREMRLELTDRLALALNSSGDAAAAAALWRELANDADLTPMGRTRALRSAGLALLGIAESARGGERAVALVDAGDLFQRALRELSMGRAARRLAPASGGFIGLEFELSPEAARGGAQVFLSLADEERLIRGGLAKVASLLGDSDAQAAQLESARGLASQTSGNSRPYERALECELRLREAELALDAGRTGEAARVFGTVVAQSHFRVGGDDLTNIDAATRAALRLAEVSVRDPSVLDTAQLAGTWLFTRRESRAWGSKAPAEVFGELLARLGRAPELADAPIATARVQLAMAILAMSRLPEAGTGELRTVEDLSRAADVQLSLRALERHAQAARAALVQSQPTPEAARLSVAATGVLIAAAARRGDNYTVEELTQQGEAEAWGRGLAVMDWWLEAQTALHHPSRESRSAARGRVLEKIGMLVPGDATGGWEIPWDVLDAVEAGSEADAFDVDWNEAEQWRAARLTLLSLDAHPVPASEAESAWLAELDAARTVLGNINAGLQESAFGSPGAERARLEAHGVRERLRALLDAGREDGHASAMALRPRAMTFADASIVLEPGAIVARPTALVLARPSGRGTRVRVMTSDGERAAPGYGAGSAQPVWLVLGAKDLEPPAGVDVVRIISTESLLAQAGALPMLTTEARTNLTTDGPVGEAAAGEVIALPARLPPGPGDPLSRVPAGWRQTLGEVIASGSRGQVLSVAAPEFPAVRAPWRAMEELALAVAAQSAGFAQLEVGNPRGTAARWIGPTIRMSEDPARAADALDSARGEAFAALRSAHHRIAASALERSLRLKAAVGDDAGTEVLNQLLAQAYDGLGRPDLAIPPGKAAVARIRGLGDDAALREALLRVGGNASRAKMWDEAARAFEEAASLARAAGDFEGAITAKVQLGIVRENASEFTLAIECFERAATLSAEGGDEMAALRHRLRIARVHALGRNDYPAAEEVLRGVEQRIVHFQVRAMPVPEGLDEVAVRLHLDLGRVRERRGFYVDAREEAEQALQAARAMGSRALEAEALRDLANLAWLRSDYLGSFTAQRESLAIAEEIGDARLAVSLHNVAGLLRWSVGDPATALSEFDRAVSASSVLRDDRELASSLNNRAIALRALRRYDEALAGFEDTYRADSRAASRWGMAYARRNTAITLVEMGRATEAAEPLAESLQLARAIGDRTSAAKSLLFVGEANRLTGDAPAAAAAYAEALAEADSIPLPEVAWRAHHGLAMLARDRADLPAAAAGFRSAIDVVESLRASIRLEEFQDGFLADKQAPYDALVTTLLDMGDARGAFEVSERSRGRNFIDLLGNRTLALSQAADGESLERERVLRIAIEEAERAVGSADASTLGARRAALAEARTRYSDFMLELRARNPQLAAFVRVEPVGLDEVQSLLEPDTRLLVYHVTDAEVIAWVIGRDFIQAARTPVGRRELAAQVESLRARLQSLEDVDREVGLLSRTLLQPVAGLIADARRLGVVPHRELHALPFAVLRPMPGGEPLIASHAVFGAPGCSVLRHTFARRGQAMANGSVLAVGDPDTAGALPELPFAQREAERLAVQYPEATLLTGGRATESWLADNIGEFSVIHIASHGEFDPANPLHSALRLAPDSKNDGLLTSAEVFGLALRADLVALSACQTGLGRLSNGDDIVGLNRAFVFAGTRQVISTLWRVDDVSTAVLMKHFYRNMAAMDRAEALRQAQLSVRARQPHPAHWGGVVLSGDWR